MEDKCYMLTAKEILTSYILGVFTSREAAEEQLKRIERLTKSPYSISLTKLDIVEVPFNSTKIIDEAISDFKRELGL